MLLIPSDMCLVVDLVAALFLPSWGRRKLYRKGFMISQQRAKPSRGNGQRSMTMLSLENDCCPVIGFRKQDAKVSLFTSRWRQQDHEQDSSSVQYLFHLPFSFHLPEEGLSRILYCRNEHKCCPPSIWVLSVMLSTERRWSVANQIG